MAGFSSPAVESLMSEGDRPMNILPFDRQVAAIAALTEGCSIRATERLTGIHRDTIMRLGIRVTSAILPT